MTEAPTQYPTVTALTQRQWLAGMAMQGLLANPQVSMYGRELSVRCYAAADAMLAHEADLVAGILPKPAGHTDMPKHAKGAPPAPQHPQPEEKA